MPTNPNDHYLLDLPNTHTLRVHELAKASNVPSATALWLLRLIGVSAKSPSSKVTLQYIEVDIVWEALLSHEHEPLVTTIVPIGGTEALTARCVCSVVLRSTDDTGTWKVRR